MREIDAAHRPPPEERFAPINVQSPTDERVGRVRLWRSTEVLASVGGDVSKEEGFGQLRPSQPVDIGPATRTATRLGRLHKPFVTRWTVDVESRSTAVAPRRTLVKSLRRGKNSAG